jgi:hypothetical protein
VKHAFRDSNPNGRLDPKRLAAFEAQLGDSFPEPYRTFLLQHNGCRFGSEEMPSTFFGLHDEEYTSLDGPTYPNEDFLPPEVVTIGLDYGDTPWLIGVAGPHRGKAFRVSHSDSDWESASEGGDVWKNVEVVAPDFNALLDLIAAQSALEDGDQKRFIAYLDEGHDVNAPIQGWVPLETALAAGHIDLARALLARGAQIDKVEDSMFRSIGDSGSIDALLFYADAMKDINRPITHEDWTLLDLAVWQDHAEATKALLKRGAKPSGETFRLGDQSSKAIRRLLQPYQRPS